jgi:NAD(P)-dependent dehydrogenase (short-subunit alcohol dehydrogenase family)
MSKILSGKSVVVTGSGRGLGREIAIAMAAQGAKVVINDLGSAVDGSGKDVQVAAMVADEIKKAGGVAVANSDNVASMEGAENIINTAVKNFGKIDILVNCAGILRDRMIFNMSEAEWDDVIRVHMKGHFACCKAAAIKMKEQKSGRIINFTSVAGTDGSIGQVNYSAAKSGIVGLTKSLAAGLSKYNITVNAVSPAAATRMTASIPEDQIRMYVEAAGMKVTPKTTIDEMQKWLLGDPAAVPPLVIYLASDHAADVTGQVFQVRGGNIGTYAQSTIIRKISKPSGIWSVEELIKEAPEKLTNDLPGPAGILGF